jgi:hypothetical protein
MLMMMRKSLVLLVALVVVFFVTGGVAGASMIISGSDIVASTELPALSVPPVGTFSIEQIADGITSDISPFNGFGSTSSSGTITLDLVSDYNLESFLLWNDINVEEEGIKDFSLVFFDGADALIPLNFSAEFSAPLGQLAEAEFIFAEVVLGVSRVDLVVLNSHPYFGNRIEIREVAFTGTLIPEPNTALLLGVGLVGLGIKRRSRRAVLH